jgi:hypothetical protein
MDNAIGMDLKSLDICDFGILNSMKHSVTPGRDGQGI